MRLQMNISCVPIEHQAAAWNSCRRNAGRSVRVFKTGPNFFHSQKTHADSSIWYDGNNVDRSPPPPLCHKIAFCINRIVYKKIKLIQGDLHLSRDAYKKNSIELMKTNINFFLTLQKVNSFNCL